MTSRHRCAFLPFEVAFDDQPGDGGNNTQVLFPIAEQIDLCLQSFRFELRQLGPRGIGRRQSNISSLAGFLLIRHQGGELPVELPLIHYRQNITWLHQLAQSHSRFRQPSVKWSGHKMLLHGLDHPIGGNLVGNRDTQPDGNQGNYRES